MKEANKGGHEGRIARLRAGETIKFSERGNSMMPKIHSRQECTYKPVLSEDDVSVGNAVYCRVKGNYYTHLVTAKRTNGGNVEFQISNNKGYVNGWVTIDKIFGRVAEVEGQPVRW